MIGTHISPLHVLKLKQKQANKLRAVTVYYKSCRSFCKRFKQVIFREDAKSSQLFIQPLHVRSRATRQLLLTISKSNKAGRVVLKQQIHLCSLKTKQYKVGASVVYGLKQDLTL